MNMNMNINIFFMTPRRMVHDRVKRVLPTQLCNQDEKRQSSNIATWRSDK